MATATLFEFRCTSCYQSIVDDTDLAGQQIRCKWCGADVEVPEPTDDAIQRAAKMDGACESAGQLIDFSADSQLTKQDRQALAKKLASEKRRNGPCRNPATASAGRFERFAAFVIDWILSSVIVLLSLKLVMLFYADPEVDVVTAIAQATPMRWAFLAIAITLPCAFALGTCVAIAMFGRTVGKYLMNIKIVDGNGHAPGLLQGVVLRQFIPTLNSLVPWIPLMAYLNWLPTSLALDTKTGYELAAIYIAALGFLDIAMISLEPPRCLHDRMAGTYVVNG